VPVIVVTVPCPLCARLPKDIAWSDMRWPRGMSFGMSVALEGPRDSKPLRMPHFLSVIETRGRRVAMQPAAMPTPFSTVDQIAIPTVWSEIWSAFALFLWSV